MMHARVLGACLTALAAAAVVVTLVPGRPVPRASAASPLVAAHRGGAGLWPENSVLAFRNALRLGVDALEFDLHLTRDGEVVVVHDATLDRTTTGTGPVADRALAALAPLRLKTRDGLTTEEPLPTFAQVLELAAASPVEVLPEIKLGPDRARYAGIEQRVVALLQAHGLLGRATVQSFDGPTLLRVRELAPALRTMALAGQGWTRATGKPPAEAVAWAASLGATDLGMDHRMIDTDVVAAARRSRVRLSAWTVNEETDVRRMIDLGVDILMTDRPDLALRLLRR